ncbi:ImmA/IrrE family metallo-endopeptidase [Desulfococcaceae bacterium HSG7]|nr:ImmA/IrrE family metallo-endopeptidase [Desulfococcaceae bacterium HSG7]
MKKEWVDKNINNYFFNYILFPINIIGMLADNYIITGYGFNKLKQINRIMEKITINPNRLQWCMNTSMVNIDDLSNGVNISMQTLERAMTNQAALSVNQLEKIANFFKRSLLFFIDPNAIQESKIYSTQFRTINNQKPIHSIKMRALIERIQQQRQIYIGLLEDLDEPVKSNWMPDFDLSTEDIKQVSADVRQWLNIPPKYNFNDLRQSVENKGVMVFISNAYNGKWQISKSDPIRGFSLYYEILPIIMIKKQKSAVAQSFTLMHELAHLLLHKESVIDDEDDFHNYKGKEKDANEFAGNLLVPDVFLNQINVSYLLSLEVNEYDNYLSDYKKLWCISVEALLVRLLINKKITQQHYQAYKDFKSSPSKKVSKKKIPRKYRHREPVHIFGKPFVYAVLDSLHSQQITLAKASSYLDNLKISDVHQLERYV